VSVAARDTSQNVGTVATAAGQLLLSTSEISRQITHSASIAEKALGESERAHTIVKGFAAAAGKIGSIVSVIQNVAQSTNLLALNATIEAARAGAAGRGFGVVATEVKALATQTAAATSEIESQINGIQGAAQDVVAAIDEIGSTIREMNNASEVIGTAAGQQSATTQDIARAVQETARRTVQVTTSIGQVDHGAGLTGSAAAQVLNTANELGARSLELRTHIEKFFSGLRAA
jgi:methyl-accepting chemotaxis protein